MNLNKNFIEVFDVFTNDYKIVERSITEKKNARKNFLFGNMSSFFKKSKTNQINNEIFSDSENVDLVSEVPKAVPQVPESNPKVHKPQIPETKPDMPAEDCEPCDNNDIQLSSDKIKRAERPNVKVQREEPFSPTPVLDPVPTFPMTSPPVQQPFTPPSVNSPTTIQPPTSVRPPFAPVPPVQPPFVPGPQPVPRPPQPRPPFAPFPPRPPVQPRPPFTPAPPIFPPFPPASNRAILLLTQLYYDLGNLQFLYLQLASYTPDVNSASQLNTYANEVLILRQTVLEIYRTLTGRTLLPTSSRYLAPALTGDYCTDLGIVYNFASSISSVILQLLRIIDINTINRQLTIILATINNQLIGLNNLMSVCF